MDDYPVGNELPDIEAFPPNVTITWEGRFVRLARPVAESIGVSLFEATHGEKCDAGQWTYMSFGPFTNAHNMIEWIESVQDLTDPSYLAVCDVKSGDPLGMLSLMNIQRLNRTIELGNIWYTPAAQRTAANTEAIYLMLEECFDRLHYRRVEWKCDVLNARSKAAATRLGFSFEGVFRQHFIIKGRNRDTAWFSMLDKDWPTIKENFRRVLYSIGCTQSLGELNAKFVVTPPRN